jgi:periplasmic copper chaperone A
MMMFAPRHARAALFGLFALLAVPAHAGDDISVRQALSVKQAWSRATPKGAQVAGGYLTIENHGATADTLISAATPAAAKIEIHEMTTLDGIMMMRAIEGGLTIPPGESVTLAPGGSHLMFIGLAAPFSEGQHIDAALMFEKAGKIDVSFDIGGVGAKGPRMIVASTEKAMPFSLPAPAPAAAAAVAEDFFTHICGTRVMANVVVSPIRAGQVTVSVDLENSDELPLTAQALAVTLSNADAPAAPVTVEATRITSDKWRVSLPADAAGKWSLALGIQIAAHDRVDIAAPVLIAK